MELDKTETEKILGYLQSNLEGHPIIDAIITGIFIGEDFTKMEKVVDVIKKARKLMNQRQLKKEDEIILFEEMIQKLYGISKVQDEASSTHSRAENSENQPTMK